MNLELGDVGRRAAMRSLAAHDNVLCLVIGGNGSLGTICENKYCLLECNCVLRMRESWDRRAAANGSGRGIYTVVVCLLHSAQVEHKIMLE